MRKDTQVIQGCMFVSFVDTTDFYNWHLFLYLYLFFDLFCFLLHYTLGLALTDQVTSALLPLHHALIMVCLWSPVATSQRVRGAHRLHPLIHNQIPGSSKKNPLFLPRDKLRGNLIMDQLFLRRNATSWASISVSLLILECQSRLQVVLQMVTSDGGLIPSWRSFNGWKPFRIRMWNSAAIMLII